MPSYQLPKLNLSEIFKVNKTAEQIEAAKKEALKVKAFEQALAGAPAFVNKQVVATEASTEKVKELVKVLDHVKGFYGLSDLETDAFAEKMKDLIAQDAAAALEANEPPEPEEPKEPKELVEVCMSGMPRPQGHDPSGVMWEHDGLEFFKDTKWKGIFFTCPHCKGWWKFNDDAFYGQHGPYNPFEGNQSFTPPNPDEALMEMGRSLIAKNSRGEPMGYDWM